MTDSDLLEVRGAGPTVTTANTSGPSGYSMFDRPAVDGPVHWWDAANGSTRTVALPSVSFPEDRVSHGGDWLLDADGRGSWLLRCSDGAQVSPDIDASHASDYQRQTSFTADDRLLFYGDWLDGEPALRVFDLVARRPAGVIRRGTKLLALAPDGGIVAYRLDVKEYVLATWPAGKILFRCPAPLWGTAEFSANGDRFVVFRDDRLTRQAEVWDTAMGRQLCTIPFNVAGTSVAGTRRLVTVDRPEEDLARQVVSVYDTDDGSLVGRLMLGDDERAACGANSQMRKGGRDGWTSPDGRTVAVVEDLSSPLRSWLAKQLPWLGVKAKEERIKLVHTVTGEAQHLPGRANLALFASDGQTVAVLGEGGLRVWDVPARKSLWMVLAAAAVLGLPPTWWARRRCRRLAAAGA